MLTNRTHVKSPDPCSWTLFLQCVFLSRSISLIGEKKIREFTFVYTYCKQLHISILLID